MKHIVKVTATFIVDDAKMIDWESPEGHVSDHLGKITGHQAAVLCSSVVAQPHPQDQKISKVWQEVIDKHTKKPVFADDKH